MQFLAALNHAAQITTKTSVPQPGVARTVRLVQHTRRARKKNTPSLQALTGKRVVASLLGHKFLVALCSLLLFHRGVNRARDLIVITTK